MDPKEIIAGLDKQTLDAIAQFGGDYMHYLWWKEVIIPTIGNVFVSCLVVGLIAFGAWCFVQSQKDENDSAKGGYAPKTNRVTPPPAPPKNH